MTTLFAARISEAMSLTQTDKLAIREITREMMASPEIKLALEHIAAEAAKSVCANHENICPIGRRVERAKWFAVGMVSVGAVIGLAFAPAAIKLLLVLLA